MGNPEPNPFFEKQVVLKLEPKGKG